MELFKGKSYRREALVLAAVVAGAFLFRLYFMRYHPVMVPDYDGAEYLTLGEGVFSGRPYCTSFIPPGFPVLLAVALPFFSDPQRAGMFVSAAFGALLIVPVYLLARELFDRKAALAAAVLAASFGGLVTASTWVMAEMPFAFFLYVGLYASVVFMRRMDRFSASVAGGFFGAAYLVRPDTVAIFAAVWLFTGARASFKGEASFRAAASGLALGLAVFLLMALPYLVHLRMEHGSWTVSGKLAYNLDSDAPGQGGALGYAAGHLGTLAAKYGRNVSVLGDVLAEEFPLPLIVLALLGMAASALWCRGRPIGFCCPMLLVAYALALPLFFVDERILGPYYPVPLIWAAAGLTFAEDRLFSAWPMRPARLYPVTAAVLIAFCAYFAGDLNSRLGSRDFADVNRLMCAKYLGAGDWLRANTSPGDRVISRDMLYCFYGRREYAQLPDCDPGGLASIARERHARYVLVDDMCLIKRRALGPLLGPLCGRAYNGPGFREVYANARAGVVIYEVEGGS